MKSNDSFGVSHLSDLPITVWYAAIIALALVALALLRHAFGSIRLEAGTH